MEIMVAYSENDMNSIFPLIFLGNPELIRIKLFGVLSINLFLT
jgi:hypothetical protein